MAASLMRIQCLFTPGNNLEVGNQNFFSDYVSFLDILLYEHVFAHLLQIQPLCFVAIKEEVNDGESNDEETPEERDICQER